MRFRGTADDVPRVAAIGSVPVLSAPSTVPVRDEETDQDVTFAGPWDVIVWDDPVNLMSYVVYVFRKVFGFPEPVARKLMLDVHHKGKALVASEPREMAEMHVKQLHAHGLHATMQRSQ
jgi:ATP-dependent Clp protease adaptor protein ClpS